MPSSRLGHGQCPDACVTQWSGLEDLRGFGHIHVAAGLGLESCSPICPEDAVLPFDRKSRKCLWFCSVRHRVGARTPTLRMAKQ